MMTPLRKAHFALRFSSLGDLVLCSGFAQKLEATYPEDALYFITDSQLKAFVQECFPLQKTKIIGRDALKHRSYFSHAYKIAKKLLKKYPNIETIQFYDLHGVSKSRWWIRGFKFYCFWTQKKIKFQTKKTAKKSLLRQLSVLLKKDLVKRHFVYRAHQKHLKPKERVFLPKLKTPLSSSSLQKRSLLIAPDSQQWKKRWLVSHWDELLKKLLSHHPNLDLSLVGGRKSLPEDLIDDLKEFAPNRIQNLLGKTQLTELPKIAQAHQLTLCGNSAWLHISEAVGTPVISLAGPIIPGFGFAPWMPQSRELSVPLKCRPCSKHGGGLCHRIGNDFHACMAHITPENVYEEILKRMELQTQT